MSGTILATIPLMEAKQLLMAPKCGELTHLETFSCPLPPVCGHLPSRNSSLLKIKFHEALAFEIIFILLLIKLLYKKIPTKTAINSNR